MALALPGARNLFSQIKHALINMIKTRIALNKGVHQALNDFRWLSRDMLSGPTRIAELVSLYSSAERHHNASGKGAGGVWFPAAHITPREGASNQPLVWTLRWPLHISSLLTTNTNPGGTITNSDLELTGGLLHPEALVHTFDSRKRRSLVRQTTSTPSSSSKRTAQ